MSSGFFEHIINAGKKPLAVTGQEEMRFMNSILQYVQWRGDLSFFASPVCPVDALIFSELVHAPFEKAEGATGSLKYLRSLIFPVTHPEEKGSMNAYRRELWDGMDCYPRFARAGLVLFSHSFDEEREMQFAAALFMAGDTGVVVFRGTDGSLVGWKEDLNMSFCEVPSQTEAARFLSLAAERAAELGLKRLILCGHSKGGNLAMFAAARADAGTREKIEKIYCFDAPGLSDEMMAGEGWNSVKDKVIAYVPESSVIGLLLGNCENRHIVDSDSVSIWQHNPFKWHVMGCDLVEAEGLTLSSRVIDRTIDEFLKKYPLEKRCVLVNALYDALKATGADSIKALPAAVLLHMKDVRQVLNESLPEGEGAEIWKLLLSALKG